MRNVALTLVLAAFFLSPFALFAQRLSLTPPAVTIMEGDSKGFTVVLSSEPTANVTVTMVRSDGTDIGLDKPELTFTPANWNIPQTVTLTAAEDENLTDDSGTLILIASGGGYDGDGVIVRPKAARILSLGKSTQLNATVHDQDESPVTGVAFNWSSADPSVALVDSTGKVTAVNFGMTTITAALAAVSGTAEILVDNTPYSDREILEILYTATGGEEWNNREGWLTDAPLNDWYGVTTNTEGRVTGLSLRENNLSGPIPPELGNLTRLEEWLELQTNSLTGPVPPELGKLTQLKRLNLGENSLTGTIPPELGNLTQLQYLLLPWNKLTGPIPPELGNLTRLKILNLASNYLTAIPPEFANLGMLSALWLGGNHDMEGLLPRSLLNLSLSVIGVRGTGICNHQDAVFLEWWNSLLQPDADDCTPGEIERLALIELRDKTNGASWANASGWGSDIPIDRWHGVTVENGRVTELSLPNNVLSGLIPGVVANFAELSVLNLADNSLSGALPKEISSLSNLTELRVNDNTGLDGLLGEDLMNLEKLEVLHFGGTSLCAPPSRGFQTWYEGIGNVSGALCSNPAEVRLDIPAADLVQSVQTPQNTVRLIEGRDALLRVFVTGDQTAFFEHEVVATVHGGGRTHRAEMTRARDRIAMAVDESNLDNSFNAVIPADLITPGATLVIEADPDGVVPRAVGSQDRFPATGEAPLQVVSVPDMEANQPDQSIFEWTDNIGDDSPEVGLFKYSFPFHEFRASSRSEYITSLDLTSDDGQWELVLELEALRLLDHASGYYYGAAASVNGFVRGRARLGGWTSIGKAWDTELAHEVGHNLSLAHAPCGGALGVDPDFPHPGGSVGAWGYDFRDSTLVSPEYRRDIMGYCYEQGWLSDYYFEKVIDYRERREGASGPSMAGAPSDVLVLWGGVQGGELRLEPPFPATAPAQLPEADGPYRLDGLGQNTVIFSLSFTPGEDKYFFFAIPIEQDWEESLERIVLTGPEGSLTVSADDQRALSVVRDANTGQVRAILRDWDGVLPAALETADDLDILTTQSLSDAVRLQR